jgi:hypothetical protein
VSATACCNTGRPLTISLEALRRKNSLHLSGPRRPFLRRLFSYPRSSHTPQPSPLGRGGIVGHAEHDSAPGNRSQPVERCSLSLRERAGVRGNRTRDCTESAQPYRSGIAVRVRHRTSLAFGVCLLLTCILSTQAAPEPSLATWLPAVRVVGPSAAVTVPLWRQRLGGFPAPLPAHPRAACGN